MFHRLLPLVTYIRGLGLRGAEADEYLLSQGVPRHSDSYEIVTDTMDKFAQGDHDGEGIETCLRAQIEEYEVTKKEMRVHFGRMENFGAAAKVLDLAPPDRYYATYYAIRDLYLSVETALLEEARKEWKGDLQSAPINRGVDIVEQCLCTLFNKVLDSQSPALISVCLDSGYDAERATQKARCELDLIRTAKELQTERKSLDEELLMVISELCDFTAPVTIHTSSSPASGEILLTELRDMSQAQLARHLGEFVTRLRRDQIQDLIVEAYRFAR